MFVGLDLFQYFFRIIISTPILNHRCMTFIRNYPSVWPTYCRNRFLTCTVSTLIVHHWFDVGQRQRWETVLNDADNSRIRTTMPVYGTHKSGQYDNTTRTLIIWRASLCFRATSLDHTWHSIRHCFPRHITLCMWREVDRGKGTMDTMGEPLPLGCCFSVFISINNNDDPVIF